MHPHPVPNQSNKYRPELDGIRALAIIAVIAYHAGVPYFSRGFVGVDFFFVISGYLITGILAHEALNTGRLDLSGFYARRIRRLMPAALFMLTICVALYAWFIPPVVGNYWALARSIATNAFFASNFFFYRQGNGYFDESMTQFPLLHTWSLSVEEQYYLLWPLLIWAIVKWQVRPAGQQVSRTTGQQDNRTTGQQDNLSPVRKLRGLLWILFIVSLVFCVYYTDIDEKFAFYLLPARIWEFAAGGLLALYLLNIKLEGEISRKQAWLGTALATLGVVLCVLSIQFVDGNTLQNNGLWAVWPVGGMTALIAGLTLNRSGFWSRFFSLRPLVWLGLLSYSWYLWHWPLLTIHKIYALGGDTLTERMGMCLLALLAAYVSYRFVERPIRERRPWLFKTTKGTLIAGGGMVLMMLVLAAAILASKNIQQRDSMHEVLEAAKDDRVDAALCVNSDQSFPELAICKSNTSVEKTNTKSIVLWGDSHADHFTGTLLAMYPDHYIHRIAFPGCPPLIDDDLQVYNYNATCQKLNKTALAHIKSLGTQLDHIYVSARWPMYFGQSGISVAEDLKDYPRDTKMLDSMSLGLGNVFLQLSQLPTKTTVIGATPELILNAPKCLMTHQSESCNVTREATDKHIGPSYTALQTIVQQNPSLNLVDLRPYFCDESTCFASKNGRSLYTDDDHITATTARELADYLKR